MMHVASLCILTCNQVEGTERLIDSIRATKDLEVEVVIGDNSYDNEAAVKIGDLADTCFKVHDTELWTDGFGPTKQRIVQQARHPLVIIGDPDESWAIDTTDMLDDPVGVWRTRLEHEGKWVEHGRVFNSRAFRLLGLIHESPFHRRTRAHWSRMAPTQHFATITHHDDPGREEYCARKQTLYDNLLYRAHENKALRYGIDNWWFEVYMPGLLDIGWTPSTLQQWQEEEG